MYDPFKFDEKDRPVIVQIQEGLVTVTLADGRVISNPLDWHLWLANATPAQQAHVELDHVGLEVGEQIEAVVAGAEVVKRHREAEPLVFGDDALEAAHCGGDKLRFSEGKTRNFGG